MLNPFLQRWLEAAAGAVVWAMLFTLVAASCIAMVLVWSWIVGCLT